MSMRWVLTASMSLIAAGCSAESPSVSAATESSDPEAAQVAVIGPEEADHLWIGAESKDSLGPGGEFHIYVDPVTHPEAAASFARFGLGVGGSLPVHRHNLSEEIGYFLSGQGMVTVYEKDTPRDIPVRPGHVVYIPPGAWHTIKNTGQEPFSLVFATIPNHEKGLLSFFRRIGVKPGEEAPTLAPDEFARLAAEHDLILRPPEPAP